MKKVTLLNWKEEDAGRGGVRQGRQGRAVPISKSCY